MADQKGISLMADFNFAVEVILAHEGTDTNYWVNDPKDPGGETVWGWSMSTIKNLGLKPKDLGLSIEDFAPGCLKMVSKDACRNLYRKFFWDKPGYGKLTDDVVATKIMDIAVNCGPNRAHKMAQTTANKLGQNLVVDGQLGNKSYAGINACTPKEFVAAIAAEQLAYYQSIVVSRPALGVFLHNWTKRAGWVGP